MTDETAKSAQMPEPEYSGLTDSLRRRNELLQRSAEGLVFKDLPTRFDPTEMGTEAMIHYVRHFIADEAEAIAAMIYNAPYVTFALHDDIPAMKLAIALDHLSAVTSRLYQVRAYSWEDTEPGYEPVV